MSISALARTCDKSLNKVMNSLKNTSNHASRSGTFSESLGRLRVWANNLGTYQHPFASSSLKYRLRTAQDSREAILDELDTIHEWASRGGSP